MVLCLTAGTAFVMWLAELITQRGIGQGMSILIFANVVAAIPNGGRSILAEGGQLQVRHHHRRLHRLAGGHRLLRPGPAANPGHLRPAGGRAANVRGSSTYIPLKVNQSGVIPIIFASSVLYIPVLLSNVIQLGWFQNFVRNSLTPTSFFYIGAYFVLIFMFTFFYVYVAFDPHQQADIIRKQGGFIPGIRPGPPTERYFAHILSRITVVGAVFLATVAVVPSVLMALWHLNRSPSTGRRCSSRSAWRSRPCARSTAS
jgi:preprotein translocase subunit SecY